MWYGRHSDRYNGKFLQSAKRKYLREEKAKLKAEGKEPKEDPAFSAKKMFRLASRFFVNQRKGR